MRARHQNAFTLAEAVVAIGLIALVLGLLGSVLARMSRDGSKAQAQGMAVLHAESAAVHLQCELRAMLPPGAAAEDAACRIGASGASLSFFRTEARGEHVVARPVLLEVRPTARRTGNYNLYRDGRPIPNVLVRELTFALYGLEESTAGESRIRRSYHPTLAIRIVGVGEDRPPHAGEALHVLWIEVPVPQTSPRRTEGLPGAVTALIDYSIAVNGSLHAGD